MFCLDFGVRQAPSHPTAAEVSHSPTICRLGGAGGGETAGAGETKITVIVLKAHSELMIVSLPAALCLRQHRASDGS